MSISGYTFVLAEWSSDRRQIVFLREQVFVRELRQRPALGAEENDERAYHVLVYDSGGRAVGAGRMQPDGGVDYVVVLKPWCGNTVGGALLTYLVHIAHALWLDSAWSIVPVSTQGFFQRNGFVPVGEEFTRNDAPHRKMVRLLGRTHSDAARAPIH